MTHTLVHTCPDCGTEVLFQLQRSSHVSTPENQAVIFYKVHTPVHLCPPKRSDHD